MRQHLYFFQKSPLDNARTGTDAAERELGIPPILNPGIFVPSILIMSNIPYRGFGIS
jgi:hypothetical protein